MFDYGHLAENFARPKLRKNAARIAADQSGDFHLPVFYKKNAVTGRTFHENLPAGSELLLLADKSQRLQFAGIETAKQSDGFEFDHKLNLLEKAVA